MTDAIDDVIDLIFGRWRSQTLYAGVELGVFEVVGEYPKHTVEITDQLDIDQNLGYRLLRALSSLGLLKESSDQRFSITPAGELLQAENPVSLRAMALLEEGPTHYALWKHLPDLVREGEQNAFEREFGSSGAFEYLKTDPEYAQVFNDAMTSYSTMETAWTLEMLDGFSFADVSHVCDVAGGQGHLLCSLLKEHSHLEGTVLELPNVVEEKDQLWAPKMDVQDRCTYRAGDMFEAAPEADVYLMKNILHDWSDEECKQILSTIRQSAPEEARLFSINRIIPDPETPHFAKLFDLHMIVWGTGRERTSEEYAELLEETGWEYVDTRYPENEHMGAIEGMRV
jgi:hypothetical protein